jgi:hypothetical protein
LKTALVNLIDGAGLGEVNPVEQAFIDAGMVYAVGSNFASQGGMGELVDLGPAPTHNYGTLYHYTDEAGQNGIVSSGEMWPSTKAKDPTDARLGDGQYFTDIAPGTMTEEKLASLFYRNSNKAYKVTHFVEVSVRSLDIHTDADRPHIMVILNSGNLNVRGLLMTSGRNSPSRNLPASEPIARWGGGIGGGGGGE